jgi:wyosine [tRNA(Phe)-imidazoG37] synthetase (radical SAM superfamily)
MGINNIPPKNCSYSCIYCQLGRTSEFAAERREFYAPAAIIDAVATRVRECESRGEAVDYLTIVPDGEPTLDSNLGKLLAGLKPLGIPRAVITNSSLLWDESVRAELWGADFLSLKVDAADAETWRRMNRPHAKFNFTRMLGGIAAFAKDFRGELVTETMLVAGVNDADAQLKATAKLVASLKPAIAYLAVPTRPPAESFVRPPSPETLLMATNIYRAEIPRVEYLVGHEGNAFAASGDVVADLLSITAVHPLRDDSVDELLRKNHADMANVRGLVEGGELNEAVYQGHRYYIRRYAGQVEPMQKMCGDEGLGGA